MENLLKEIEEKTKKELVNNKNKKVKKIIVIDNFELIDNLEIRKKLASILKKSNTNIYIYILSRSELTKEYKDMYFENKLKLIETNEFKIIRNDIKEFFKLNEIEYNNELINNIEKLINNHPIALNIVSRYLEKGYEYSEELKIKVFQDFFDYLDTKLFKLSNLYYIEFLCEIFLIENISAEKAIYVTGNLESKKILDEICSKGTFLSKEGEFYKFKDNIEEYLEYKQSTLLNKEKQKNILIKIANIYEKEEESNCIDKNIKAANIYEKLGMFEKACILLEKELTKHIGSINNNKEIKKLVKKLPEEIIAKYPLICSNLAVIYLLERNEDKYNKWLNVLKKSRNNKENTKEKNILIDEAICFCIISSPNISSINLIKELKNINKSLGDKRGINQALTITGNQPSILNGSKDYSSWANKYEILYKLLKPILEKIFNISFDGIAKIAIGEVLYQRNEKEDAIIQISKGLALVEKDNMVDMMFVGYSLLSRLFLLDNNIKGYNNMLEKINNMIEQNNINYLRNNFIASKIRINILQNKKAVVKKWIDDNNMFKEKFNILNRYEYFTLVRAYIFLEDYQNAIIWLDTLNDYINTYDRTIFKIEYSILKAVLMNKLNKNQDMIEYIEDSILIAQKYGYIRVFTDEGKELYDVIEKYIKLVNENELNKKNNKNNKNQKVVLNAKINRKFLNNIYIECVNSSKKDIKDNSILTNSENKIIDLIKEGFSNDEIADKLFISKATVKTHINHIYSKLHVKNRVQALKKLDEIT